MNKYHSDPCFNGCSVKTGQVINKRRQAKKTIMKKLGCTGKRLRKIEKRLRKINLGG